MRLTESHCGGSFGRGQKFDHGCAGGKEQEASGRSHAPSTRPRPGRFRGHGLTQGWRERHRDFQRAAAVDPTSADGTRFGRCREHELLARRRSLMKLRSTVFVVRRTSPVERGQIQLIEDGCAERRSFLSCGWARFTTLGTRGEASLGYQSTESSADGEKIPPGAGGRRFSRRSRLPINGPEMKHELRP